MTDAALPASVVDLLGGPIHSFMHEGGLRAEHTRLMSAHHHPVAWDRTTAASLPTATRSRLASVWRAATLSEHRSVGVFAQLTLDLLAVGAPAEVLSVACRATLDEVRHAELFARLTALYSGQQESPPPGIAPLPEDPNVSIRDQVAREMLFLSVGSETYSAVLLAALHGRAKDPVVRDVLGVVLADEIFHARLGWSYLASLLRAEPLPAGDPRALLQASLVPIFEALGRALFGDPRKLPDTAVHGEERALCEAHGYMARREEYRLFRDTVRDVWVPGLTALGLDGGRLLGRFPDVAPSRGD